MPVLGTCKVDSPGLATVDAWILSLPSERLRSGRQRLE